MTSPVRYTSGVSTAVKGSALFNLPDADPTKVYKYFDDFYKDSTAEFTYTEIGAGGTIGVVADEPFGAIVLTSDALDNDGCQIQLPVETFTIASGKSTWFKSRFKLSEATESDFILGLAVLDTTLLGATLGDGVTDGIFFYKDDGSTSIKMSCQLDTTTGQVTPVTVGTMTTAYTTLGFEYDGGRYIKGFMNDVHTCTIDLGSTPATYLPNTPLTVSAGFLNGAAGAKTLTIDYLFAAQER